jgi:hypothetical protein
MNDVDEEKFSIAEEDGDAARYGFREMSHRLLIFMPVASTIVKTNMDNFSSKMFSMSFIEEGKTQSTPNLFSGSGNSKVIKDNSEGL